MKINLLSLRVITAGLACLALTLACNFLVGPEPQPTVVPTIEAEPTKIPESTPTIVVPTKTPALPQEEGLLFRDDFDGSLDES